MAAIIILTVMFTIAQWSIIAILACIGDASFIKSKKDMWLWIIPIYMPIKILINHIKSLYNELE